MRHKAVYIIPLVIFSLLIATSCGKKKTTPDDAFIEKNITGWLVEKTTPKTRLSYDEKTDIYNVIYVSDYSSTLNLNIEAIKTGAVDYDEVLTNLDWDSMKAELSDLTKNVINQLREFGVKDPKVILSFYDKTQNNCYLKFSNDGLIYDKFDEVK